MKRKFVRDIGGEPGFALDPVLDAVNHLIEGRAPGAARSLVPSDARRVSN